MEQSIGVFGEEMLQWICILRQSPARPPPDHVHRQANLLLDELKGSKAAQKDLEAQAIDDGLFAIAALLDEFAMAMPDLRTVWATHPLQATRWMTNNAGVELFTRLDRVRQGPKTILATYVAVLGMGFMGRFGLPGVDRYGLVQLRRELSIIIGADTDRDWSSGVLRPTRPEQAAMVAAREPWWRSIWVGRGIAILVLLAGLATLTAVLAGNLG